MENNNYSSGEIVGIIVTWAIIIAIGLVLLQLLIWIGGPVIEHAVGFFSSFGHHDYSGDGIYSLATTCIIMIGIVALAKAMKK